MTAQRQYKYPRPPTFFSSSLFFHLIFSHHHHALLKSQHQRATTTTTRQFKNSQQHAVSSTATCAPGRIGKWGKKSAPGARAEPRRSSAWAGGRPGQAGAAAAAVGKMGDVAQPRSCAVDGMAGGSTNDAVMGRPRWRVRAWQCRYRPLGRGRLSWS